MTLVLDECIVIINKSIIKIFKKTKVEGVLEMFEDKLKEIEELNQKLLNIANEMKSNKKKLYHDLEIVEKKIKDIQHYIEIYNVNAAEGYKAYKLLQESLKERRVIKDELFEMKPIVDSLYNSGNNVNNTVSKVKQRLENRKYNVKILKEVFGKTMKNTH